MFFLGVNKTRCSARWQVVVLGGCVVLASLGGCSSVFNPSFLSLLSDAPPTGTGIPVGAVTIDNAPGHVPIIFVNNTRFDQNLLDYFEDIGVDITDPNLRPRVRVRVDVLFANGNNTTFEFLDGSDVIQGSVQTAAGTQQNPLVPAALTDFALLNVVTMCEVERIEPNASIEVFVPAFLKVIGFEGDQNPVRVLNETIPPQFTVLETDDVDNNGNVTLQRNFDIRDTPAFVNDVQCGSVVGFVLSGTLRVPFVLDEIGQVLPGYRVDDQAAQASSPGRFEFLTTVR